MSGRWLSRSRDTSWWINVFGGGYTARRPDGGRLTAWFDDFLVEREPLPWQSAEGMPSSIIAGKVSFPGCSQRLGGRCRPGRQASHYGRVRKAWKARHGGRAPPVLLAIGYPGADGLAVALCGPAADDPPVHLDVELSRLERLAETALAEPTRHAAQRCLLHLRPEIDSELPGLFNSGLLRMTSRTCSSTPPIWLYQRRTSHVGRRRIHGGAR